MANGLSVTDIIDKVKSQICDEYCKYPDKYDIRGKTTDDLEAAARADDMYDEVCDNCPLDQL